LSRIFNAISGGTLSLKFKIGAMAETLVSFSRVAKHFKAFTALEDVSFSVNEGEIFGYIGPNGAGKTTTIKLLIGLLTHFEGEIKVGDLTLPKDLMQLHRLVGYLPQSPEFQSWRTINQALVTFGRLNGVPDSDINARIPILLERFELGEWRHKKIKNLSGGMKQKVGFVQALLHKPKLLVLDEPLTGLDPESRLRMKEQILQLKDEGTTVLFSSHILGDVQDIADRIGIIKQGKIVQTGSMEELMAHFDIGKEIVVDYSAAPSEVDWLQTLPEVLEAEQRSFTVWGLKLSRKADIDGLVHQVIVRSLDLGGHIRRIGEAQPSLDELYRRFIQPRKN
jgi:ABC-2 type transport system ATP-binding protein